MKPSKTNSARLLDQARMDYQLVSYQVDPDDLSAIHVAEVLGQPVEQVFKTLVLKGDPIGFFVCIVSGALELDLKIVAKVTGNKSCAMIPMNSLLATTGYIRGACSPIGMKKLFPTFLDASCQDFNQIYVSAGVRGLQIQLNPGDLIRMVGAKVVKLV